MSRIVDTHGPMTRAIREPAPLPTVERVLAKYPDLVEIRS